MCSDVYPGVYPGRVVSLNAQFYHMFRQSSDKQETNKPL